MTFRSAMMGVLFDLYGIHRECNQLVSWRLLVLWFCIVLWEFLPSYWLVLGFTNVSVYVERISWLQEIGALSFGLFS